MKFLIVKQAVVALNGKFQNYKTISVTVEITFKYHLC